jgi:hypothetical protein
MFPLPLSCINTHVNPAGRFFHSQKLNIMKQPLRMPKLPLVVAAISFALLSIGCKKPTLNPTPVGLEIEYLGSNWDLSLCNKFHEGLKDAELEIWC